MRRIGLLSLIFYIALVVLASWRYEIRPGLLEEPAAGARSILHSLGITPAIAVFTSDVARETDVKKTALCIEVRIVEHGGHVRQLYPEAGRRCPATTPRLGFAGEEIALYRVLTVMRAAIASARSGPPGAGRGRRPDLLVEWVAEHFRLRAAAQGLRPDSYVLRWRESKQSFATGKRSESVVALLRWWPDSERSLALSWRPDAEKRAALWPSLAAP
ncbi:MAG: hypothetical protein VX466_02490 [Myxococcota bacterium]|nr:hypothetical protein [Myxococcota bacterium]